MDLTIGCTAGCKVNVLDSLYNTIPLEVKRQIAILMHSPTKTLKMNFLNVAKQQGGSDCGLYAIANAAAVCAGLDATTLQYEQSSMRHHLLRCLERGTAAAKQCFNSFEKGAMFIIYNA